MHKTIDSVIDKTQILLEKRYPGLAFLLNIAEQESEYREVLDEEIAIEGLQEVEGLYLFGLSLASNFFNLQEWLEAKQDRHLIVVDYDLGSLSAFLTSQVAPLILKHPRVHLRFPLAQDRLESLFQECAQDFPIEKIHFIASSEYAKKHEESIEGWQRLLYIETTKQHALFQEQFYNHLFFRNSLANMKTDLSAFIANDLKNGFQGVPAIICGAGPSLEKDLEKLKHLYDKAIIISAGSSIAALSRAGVDFHMAMAIDPNDEEVRRFKENVVFETVLIYVNRLHNGVFTTLNGSFGALQTPAGGRALQAIKKALKIEAQPLPEGFGLDAMSVTTTALELTTHMGCSPIILTGVDLAYTGDKRYLPGVVEGGGFDEKREQEDKRCSEKLVKVKDIHNEPIFTLSKWQMESRAITQFIKKHPDTHYLNATMGGIGIEGVKNIDLASINFDKSLNIEGMIDVYREVLVKDLDGVVDATHLQEEWQESLCEGRDLCKKALDHIKAQEESKGNSDGLLIYLDFAFKDLSIFDLFFKENESAFEKAFSLTSPSIFLSEDEEGKLRLETLFLENVWRCRHHIVLYLIDSF